MNFLPTETISNIILHMTSFDSIKEFCTISKYHNHICKMYGNDIAKRMIDIYNIDYKDPCNFIYIMNNISIDECKYKNGEFNYKKIVRLYLVFYNDYVIDCVYREITSIPIYPKLETLLCNYNEIKELPELPNLIELHCDHNEISHLKDIYQNLEILFCRNNLLKNIPNYKKLKKLYCEHNELVSIPEYPSIEVLMCNGNDINDLPSFPNLIELHCDNNSSIVINKYKYPNLKFLNDRPF